MNKLTLSYFPLRTFVLSQVLRINSYARKLLLGLLTFICIVQVAQSQETCCNALSFDFTQVYCFSDVTSCMDGVFPCIESNFEALFPGSDIFSGTEQCSPPATTCDVIGFCDFAQSLPVELVDFNTKISDTGIELRWSTASEINNQGFTIERSIDGRDWQALEFVDGAGTTQHFNEYYYQDSRPVLGANYYRLLQLDFDGNQEYGPVKVSLWRGGLEKLQLIILPNPASEWITPVLPPSIATLGDQVSFDIYDMTGRLVKKVSKEVVAKGIRISLDALAPGQYVMLVDKDGRLYNARFAKVE